ncbi:MAG: hypothetical protein DHS20C15_32980 [Planctomycetota bacterium]|nr:MAG: hypothetical protein DHS20C15_32980 [Planctomycetota bacterium]
MSDAPQEPAPDAASAASPGALESSASGVVAGEPAPGDGSCALAPGAGFLPRLKEFALFAALAVLLTWPLAWSPDQAVARRGDYFVNTWNFWWMHEAVVEQGISPFETQALHWPRGVDLARHTLSPGNALLGGELSQLGSPHDAFKWLLLLHMTLAGFAMCQLARELTGCRAGAILAGVLYAHAPFHLYYFAQLNLGSMEGLPLAVWAMVCCWRRGGAGRMLGVALSAAWLAATSEYYLVYAGGLGALLVLGGKWWSPETPWLTGAKRLVGAGVAAAAAVALVAWPLISAMLSGAGAGDAASESGRAAMRSNDLLGFLWKGPPEEWLVSWPTMLGWSTLLFLALGWRGLFKQSYWLVLALVFLVMSLGPTLSIGGESTGSALPSAALVDLPLFSMLRKPDRFLLLVQFCVAILLASCWGTWSRRSGPGRPHRVFMAGAVLLMALEFAPAPVRTFDVSPSEAIELLAVERDVQGVVHLPVLGGSQEARVNHLATVHGHPVAQGYVTDLALGPEQRAATDAWQAAEAQLARGRVAALRAQMQASRVNIVVLHKLVPRKRAALEGPKGVIWAPFCFAREELMHVRQWGHLEERTRGAGQVQALQGTLEAAFGAAILEDEVVAVYRG